MKMSAKLIGLILTTMFIISQCPNTFANESDNSPTGAIKGKIRDMETRAPVPGVTVALSGASKGAYSDLDGNFAIKDVPVGSYILQFSSIAYEPLSKTDIIVRPNRITFVDAEMKASALEIEGVEVKGGYFAEDDQKPTSTTSFSGEQVRRAPGSAADVLRIISSLPSVAKVDDQTNSLAVRGGSPFENGFYLDGMEIDNINHFPVPGSSGGGLSLINVDLLDNVNFSAGGFGASYGNRLSSIMELNFREGNRDEFDGQIDINFAGFGAVVEGPFNKGKGSYLITGKRSYLDLVVDMIGVGIAPRLTDYQGKIAYDLSPRHSLSITGLGGTDYMDYNYDQAVEDGNDNYGITRGYSYAIGLNWRFLWGKYGYSNTNLSIRDIDHIGDYFETKTKRQINLTDQFERTIKLRNTSYLKINKSHSFEFGLEGSLLDNEYDNYFAPYTNLVGDSVQAYSFNDELNSHRYGAFISYIPRPFTGLTANLGVRWDYFEYNDNTHISPRASIKYHLTSNTALSASAGIYYQPLPGNLLVQNKQYKELKDPKAYHYVLGIEQLIRNDTKLTVEGYFKKYNDFPMDPAQPNLFILDELTYSIKIINFTALVDNGEAESYGVELTLQKKLVSGIYGLVSASLSKNRYKGLDGKWRDRNYDNRLILSAEGGYKPNHNWEFSARWVFAGGRPYTPLNIKASREINHTVLDDNRINAERYPVYHSLNLRADRRFSFQSSNIVAFVSLWNAYSRKNVAAYFWNEIEQKEDTMYQWTLLPIFGIEYEF